MVILVVIGFIGWKVWENQQSAGRSESGSVSRTQESQSEPARLMWKQSENGWQTDGAPPACPNQPMLAAPVDISQATSVLYPGQPRGGNYKPHGGFRFDNSKDNAVVVKAPLDGYIVRGGSYIAEGEIQYTFDVMNNCGIMYRLGHLRELPDNLQKIAAAWPEPSASSQTQGVSPAVFVKQGETFGTKIGLIQSNNAFFDFGVYDYRQQNQASQSSAYQSAHAGDKELSWHAVCWLRDWLPANDTAAIATLPPADPGSGKTSNYCR